MSSTDDKIFTIYKATNIENGKAYIGFDSKWPQRKSAHIHAASYGKGYLFHNAIRKYGKKAFLWDILYQSNDHDHTLHVMEELFIRQHNTHMLDGWGYNMTYGGEGTLGLSRPSAKKGMKNRYTPEQLERIRQGTIRSQTKEVRERHSKTITGRGNPAYGKRWMHNSEGKHCRVWYRDVPKMEAEGWIQGRLMKRDVSTQRYISSHKDHLADEGST